MVNEVMENTSTVAQDLQTAIQHHQAGRLSEAQSLYQKILQVEPHHAIALHFLGVIAHQTGKHSAAAELISHAIEMAPHISAFHNNLGEVYRALGEHEKALAAYRRALELDPSDYRSQTNIGTALKDLNRLEEAEANYGKAIALKPHLPEAYYNLGMLLYQKRELPAAVQQLKSAVRINSEFYEAHHNLGNIYKEIGDVFDAVLAFENALKARPAAFETCNSLGLLNVERGELDKAEAYFRQAIQNNPHHHSAYTYLGNIYKERRDFIQAVQHHQKAIQITPQAAEVYCNLGIVFQEIDKHAEAIQCFEKAIQLNRTLVEAYFNLGNTYFHLGNLTDAIHNYEEAIKHRPGYREGYNNLGNALLNQARVHEAIECYKKAHAGSNQLMVLNYSDVLSPETVFAEHQAWAAKFETKLLESHSTRDKSPDRKLRIGYVSPDFRKHVVATFFEPILQFHDKEKFEIFCYDNQSGFDKITQQLQSLGGQWRRIVNLPDPEAAKLIREDQVDILIDLTGHMANNRLPLFALKPAPIQMTYLGYPHSTGLQTIDYRISDRYADPEGMTEAFHSEQLLRFEKTAWCYQPPMGLPDIVYPPCLETDHVTFGSFNNSVKISPSLIEIWAKLLHQIPSSRLLLKSRHLGDKGLKEYFHQHFSKHGISPHRVELFPWEPTTEQHFASYQKIDIALDTFPYHGTTTTCEALWMGVPVITLAGKTHTSRVGVSLLSNLNLTELIAENSEDYIRIAKELAGDHQKLKTLRTGMRDRMKASPLFNAKRFTKDLETLYQSAWKQWCIK
jgi:protein O-GlcNAc transferase